MQEDILATLENKNPSVKEETVRFLVRSFSKSTPAAMPKTFLKPVCSSLLKVQTCLFKADTSDDKLLCCVTHSRDNSGNNQLLQIVVNIVLTATELSLLNQITSEFCCCCYWHEFSGRSLT